MTEVFISYKREEQAIAQWVAKALIGQGYRVWWDADMMPGEEYRKRTLTALRNCKAAIVLWSPQAVASSWVIDEAERAKKRGVLVPVMIAPVPVDDLPLGLGQLHTHTLVGWDGEAEHEMFAPVLRAIERLAGPREKPPKPARSKRTKTDEAELTLWLGIANSRNAADFETYLTRHPNGNFVELARDRLARLKRNDLGALWPTLAAGARASADRLGAFMRPLASAAATARPEQISGWRPLLRRSELLFIALVAVLAPFPMWPIVNIAYGSLNTFWGPDFENLFDVSHSPNLYWTAPLLTLGAWLYDRAEALAAKAPVPFALAGARVVVGVLLIVLFAAGLDVAEYDDGVSAHFALWIACVWAATIAARIVGPRLRRMFAA